MMEMSGPEERRGWRLLTQLGYGLFAIGYGLTSTYFQAFRKERYILINSGRVLRLRLLGSATHFSLLTALYTVNFLAANSLL